MNSTFNLLLDNIELCMLPRLSKNLEECENHVEYNLRENNLNSYFYVVIKLIGDIDLKVQQDASSNLLSALLILNYELESEGPWLREKCKACSKHLNHTFELFYGFKLDKLLLQSDVFNVQQVFDRCIHDLHKKLLPNDFKKYPGLIEVYYKMIQELKKYKVDVLNPMTILPISLLLIDDYVLPNKVKGIKCCLSVIHCLSVESFQTGNYYEVVFGSLKKCILEKDKDVTKWTLECLLELLKIMPEDVKSCKTDDVYKTVLDQIYTESNLYRKAICFNYVKKMIEIHTINCAKWKIFKTVVCDALDICSNQAVADILLQDVLECLEMWLKYCWCVWRLSSDQKMLSMLLKLLFVVCKDSKLQMNVENLISTLINLCSKKEQCQILKNLETADEIGKDNSEFLQSIDTIKQRISV